LVRGVGTHDSNKSKTGTICPHSYPQVWTRQSSSLGSVPATACGGLLENVPRHVRFIVWRRSGRKRHWQKLTVLSRSANRSATFRKGSWGPPGTT
jgi:hypothetical protein